MGEQRKPKQVAVVYRLDAPGGVQSCAFSLIKGLNRVGILPDILWDIEPKWSLLAAAGAQARFRKIRFAVPSQVIDQLPYSLRYLVLTANQVNGDRFRQDYDFFYIFYNGFFIANGTPHVRYMPGPPLLPQLQNVSPGLRGVPFRTFRWIYQQFLRKISPVYEYHAGGNYVTISQFTSAMFQEAYRVNLPVISPPIDLDGRNFESTDLAQRDTIMFFSRIVDYKRPEVLLELADRYPKMRCVIMGGVTPHRMPYFLSLQEVARQRNLRNVEFLENPSNQVVREELARARFYIFPTRNEHFGMTTAEAIASGAIPFVHDSGGQIEIVVDPRLRFNDAELLGKFDDLLQISEAELSEIRQKLLVHVQGYSEDVFIEKMLSFMETADDPA